ncbi:alpha/beta hydrolase [Deinococcus depolymerans]|uniref:Alpha/beta hydrolase n=1 Tax=Deinococcus depolymerans TaxID=392408 RepID=A0ABN1CK51_9DEIO
MKVPFPVPAYLPPCAARPGSLLSRSFRAALLTLSAGLAAHPAAAQAAPARPAAAAPGSTGAAAGRPGGTPEWVRPGEWVSLGGVRPSLLQAPAGCAARACSVVVVSHPRGQDAERLRDSPQVQVLIQALLRANFAVLLGSDGGPDSWGSPAGLGHLGVAHATATRRFHWNGHTYALGLSMGGLMALRSALPGAPYPVQGVALIDAWTDLEVAWGSALSRRSEIEAAYRSATRPEPGLNPLPAALRGAPLPLFVVSSLDDTTVKASLNSDRLLAHALPGVSEFLPVTGPHLGGNRFTPAVAQRLVKFFERLDTLESPPATPEIPSLPSARPGH